MCVGAGEGVERNGLLRLGGGEMGGKVRSAAGVLTGRGGDTE